MWKHPALQTTAPNVRGLRAFTQRWVSLASRPLLEALEHPDLKGSLRYRGESAFAVRMDAESGQERGARRKSTADKSVSAPVLTFTSSL